MRASLVLLFLGLLATAAGQAINDQDMNQFLLNRMNAQPAGK